MKSLHFGLGAAVLALNQDPPTVPEIDPTKLPAAISLLGGTYPNNSSTPQKVALVCKASESSQQTEPY